MLALVHLHFMAKDQSSTVGNFRRFGYLLFVLSSVSSISFLYWSHYSGAWQFSHNSIAGAAVHDEHEQDDSSSSIHLPAYTSAWNHLSFSSDPPPKLLKIALFVKKWPHRNLAGGLERHALALHLALAKRGHELHIFTTSSSNLNASYSFPAVYPHSNVMNFHLSRPTPAGYLDQALVWKQFQTQNSTGKPFDVIHTESVGLLHTRARNLTNLAVSWHGIAYETMHSDIIQELVRSPF